MKTILTMVAVALIAGASVAGETSFQAAKKNLNEEIATVFKKSLKDWDNYFYENDVNSLREDVEIALYVNEDKSLRVLQVKSNNPDAIGYVKHTFSTEQFHVDDVLKGKAYRFTMRLMYKAR